MKRRVIDKSAVAGFIDDLRQEYTVFAPVERDGLLNFEPLRRAEDARLDFANSKRPPKEILFPRSETLFSYENGQVTSVPLPQEQTVVLGIRPCDAASLLLLDVVFDTPECEDPYYVRRRQNTVLIGLGCNRPQPTCFCTALGRGPFATEGLDLLFTDIGESYVVESITDRGEANWISRQAWQPVRRRQSRAPILRASKKSSTRCTMTGSGMSSRRGVWDVLYAATCARHAIALTLSMKLSMATGEGCATGILASSRCSPRTLRGTTPGRQTRSVCASA